MRLNKSLNRETEIYALNFWGLIVGFLMFVIVTVFTKLLWGAFGGFCGYILGKGLSRNLYNAILQRWIYKNTNIRLRGLPGSWEKNFM